MTVARLYLDVEWDTVIPIGDAMSATLGRGNLVCDGRSVWGMPVGGTTSKDGLHWHWSDVLSWLSENWFPLLFERHYPLELEPIASHCLRRQAEERWMVYQNAGCLSEEQYYDEEEGVYEFEERHNLAHAFQGLYVPNAFIFRRQEMMVISGDALAPMEMPWAEAVQCLEAIAETILARIRDKEEPIARSLMEAWRTRHRRPDLVALGWALGAPAEYIRTVAGTAGEGALPAAFGLTGERYEDNEFLAAARMGYGARVPAGTVRMILERMRTLPATPTPELDRLGGEAVCLLTERWESAPPHGQGRELARWLLKTGVPQEPEELLARWSVTLVRIPLADAPDFDALGCWSRDHGPAVLLNTASRRNRRDSGCRAALAHELCHLLVDRTGALPFAEVMDGESREPTEQRARAFAAEYLLPRESFEQGPCPGDGAIADVVCRLAVGAGVSQEIAAWQIRNSAWAPRLSEQARRTLSTFVSAPEAMG